MVKMTVEELEKETERLKSIFGKKYPDIDLQLMRKVIDCIHNNYVNSVHKTDEELTLLNKHSANIAWHMLKDIFTIDGSDIYSDIDQLYEILIHEKWIKDLREMFEYGYPVSIYSFANQEGYIAEIEKKEKKEYWRLLSADKAFNDDFSYGLECVIFDYVLDEYDAQIIAGVIEDELIY